MRGKRIVPTKKLKKTEDAETICPDTISVDTLELVLSLDYLLINLAMARLDSRVMCAEQVAMVAVRAFRKVLRPQHLRLTLLTVRQSEAMS